jgi:CrcB protein
VITYLWIALGGALGSVARYALSGAVARMLGETFPWGTIIVNVTGCFVIGVLAVTTGPEGRVLTPPDVRQFLLIGVCGGYTTFSSFSLQTLNLIRGGEMAGAAGNIGVSVIACMVAVWIGAVAGQALNQARGG